MAASQATSTPERATTEPRAEDRRRFLAKALAAAGGTAAFMTGLPTQAATIPRHHSSKVLDRAGEGVEAKPSYQRIQLLGSVADRSRSMLCIQLRLGVSHMGLSTSHLKMRAATSDAARDPISPSTNTRYLHLRLPRRRWPVACGLRLTVEGGFPDR